jgi:hypothetical protein
MNKFAQTFVNLSLTAALTFTTLTLAISSARADEVNDQTLTLAAANVGTKTVWVDTQDADSRIADELTAKTDALNDAVHAKLEQKLEAQIAQELVF